MSELLPPLPLFLTFLAASLVLAVTPGPGVFYIVARSLGQGRAAGLASVVGVALGNLSNAIAASLALAAVLAISATAFVVVKYAGAAYLIYLGVQALREGAKGGDTPVPRPLSPARVFVDGFVVALLNPQTALFFGAFLPQFLVRGTAPALESIVLGAVFVAIAAVTDSLYALSAATLGPLLRRDERFRSRARYLMAGALVGLGLFAALSAADA